MTWCVAAYSISFRFLVGVRVLVRVYKGWIVVVAAAAVVVVMVGNGGWW